MTSHQLERYSFLWSEVRLVVAAAALFLGGVPPVFYLLPALPFVALGLTFCWILSGASSVYLLYRWLPHKTLFGKKNSKDMWLFLVNVISGVNLGIAGLLGRNIGMSINSNYVVFVVVGLLYLYTAYHLYQRWNAHGQKLFN